MFVTFTNKQYLAARGALGYVWIFRLLGLIFHSVHSSFGILAKFENSPIIT